MQVHHHTQLQGVYALATTEPFALQGLREGLAGRVRFSAGTRSPEAGERTSAVHEIGYVVSGRLLIVTATQRYEVGPGSMLVMSPAEPHSTTALEDSEIFFVLLDPHLANER
jgi:quercetin dioxygenase-like cupin family protein